MQALAIPRVFHRIWLGGPMPDEFRRFGEGWLDRHPGWRLQLWDEGNLPPLRNQAAFDAAPTYAQRADIARYELLHAFGGVYLDCDFEALRCIEPLLDGVEAFAASEDGRHVSIGILGARPGHPFFAALVEAIPGSLAAHPDAPPNVQTGPLLATRLAAERRARGMDDLVVFPPELFYPYSGLEKHRRGEQFPAAYAVHHWAESWFPAAGRAAAPAVAPAAEPAAPTAPVAAPAALVAAPAARRPHRALVVLDPADPDRGAVVLSAALSLFGPADPVEVALALPGVDPVPEALAADLAARCARLVPDGHDLPEVLVLDWPAAAQEPAVLRVSATGDPIEDARAVVLLGALAQAVWEPATPPTPTAIPTGPSTGPPTGPPTGPVTPARPAAVYVGGDRLLVSPRWGGKLYCAASDLSITPDLVTEGVYDPALCSYLARTLRPGGRCVDVGANIGALTVLMAGLVGPAGAVTAYEVSPMVLPLLRDNIAVNYLNDRVTVRETAAWSEPATLTFHVSRRFQGNGSLLAHDEWYRGYFGVDEFDAVPVAAAPLDPDLAVGPPVDLVKIDVEGAEFHVLSGMAGALAAGRVGAVVVEVQRQRCGDTWPALADLLRDLHRDGWGFATLAPDGKPVDLDLEQLLAVAS